MADEKPTDPPAAPATGGEAAGEDGGAAPSKKAAKKAEAKAKKEAEKARKAAEREAAAAASGKGAAAGPTEDLAKDNYGVVKDRADKSYALSPEAVDVSLKDVGDAHIGKLVKLRGWIQNARQQGCVVFPIFMVPNSMLRL